MLGSNGQQEEPGFRRAAAQGEYGHPGNGFAARARSGGGQPGPNGAREYYNINADDLAAALAVALKADRLFYLTESGGVWDAERNACCRW